MSQSVSDVIKEKLANIDLRKAERPDDANNTMQTLADYSFYFQGAEEFAKAVGAEAEDLENIAGVRSLIESEISALERRQALLQRLG